MSLPRQAATIRESREHMAADRGPPVEHFAVPEDMPELYRWAPDDTSDPDGLTVLGHQGGTEGTWILVRRPDQGEDLADTDSVILVGENRWRVLPSATLSRNRTKTLSTENAREGDWIEITRLDTTANTLAIVNSGPLGGTLCVMPVSAKAWATFYFNGTDWLLRRNGLMF